MFRFDSDSENESELAHLSAKYTFLKIEPAIAISLVFQGNRKFMRFPELAEKRKRSAFALPISGSNTSSSCFALFFTHPPPFMTLIYINRIWLHLIVKRCSAALSAAMPILLVCEQVDDRHDHSASQCLKRGRRPRRRTAQAVTLAPWIAWLMLNDTRRASLLVTADAVLIDGLLE